MENLFRLPFSVVQWPDLKWKKPSRIRKPSSMTVLFCLLVSYFLVTIAAINDIIVKLFQGTTTDEYGHQKPSAFMAWRINGQYIMEGLAAAFMFTLGGLGFILLDQTNKPNMPCLNRIPIILLLVDPHHSHQVAQFSQLNMSIQRRHRLGFSFCPWIVDVLLNRCYFCYSFEIAV